MEKNFSQRLKEVLFLLASEPDVQINAFPDFVHIPDEIVSETSDAIEYAPNEISQEDTSILNVLRTIDSIFDKMVGDANNWIIDSINTNPQWQHVRLLAQEGIDKYKLTYKQPDLFWISYFREKPLG